MAILVVQFILNMAGLQLNNVKLPEFTALFAPFFLLERLRGCRRIMSSVVRSVPGRERLYRMLYVARCAYYAYYAIVCVLTA